MNCLTKNNLSSSSTMKVFVRVIQILGAPNNQSQQEARSFSCILIPSKDSQTHFVSLKGLGKLHVDVEHLLNSRNVLKQSNNLILQPGNEDNVIPILPNLLVRSNNVIWYFDIDNYSSQLLYLKLMEPGSQTKVMAQLKLPLSILPMNQQINHSFPMQSMNDLISPPKVLLNIEISNANPLKSSELFMCPIGDLIMAQRRQKQVMTRDYSSSLPHSSESLTPNSKAQNKSLPTPLDNEEIIDEDDDSVSLDQSSSSDIDFPKPPGNSDSDNSSDTGTQHNPSSKEANQSDRKLFFPVEKYGHHKKKKLTKDDKPHARSLVFDSATFKRLLKKNKEKQRKSQKGKHTHHRKKQEQPDTSQKGQISNGQNVGAIALNNIFLNEAIINDQSTQQERPANPFIQAVPCSSQNLHSMPPLVAKNKPLRSVQSMNLNPFIRSKNQNLDNPFAQPPQLLASPKHRLKLDGSASRNIVKRPVIKTKSPFDIISGKSPIRKP